MVRSRNGSTVPHLLHVSTSGGVLTEESLVKLRDNFDKDPDLCIQGYGEKGEGSLTRTQFEVKVTGFRAWATEFWDDIAPRVDQLDISRLRGNWALPFFRFLGYDPIFQRSNEIFEGPSEGQASSVYLSHRGWDSAKAPRIHIVLTKEGFDSPAASDRNEVSPHDAMQRFLVLSKDVDWGILFNGRSVRLLRKYYHEYTRGYVEFDLESILEERDLDEFRLLYLLLHASSLRKGEGGKAPIDGFYEKSRSTGVKVGDRLRDNVKEALELLGNGLLGKEELGRLEVEPGRAEEFFSQLLRVFYRILFILYAEQRGMLPKEESRRVPLYVREYSVTRLRGLAEGRIEADGEVDLWRGLQRMFSLVEKGSEELGVVAYNGDLFSPARTEMLNRLACRNDTLLKVIRLLTTVERDGVRSRISYIDIDVEEIGSIYESLLDYRPTVLSEPRVVEGVNHQAHRFLLLPRGLERKTTGSYYTHKGLVNILVKTALAPVVEARLKAAGADVAAKRDALLSVKVCDPACGGGTFLIAALDYLGLRLARLESGLDQPSEERLREARRTVLMHCIYGVDRNPLAVELAKISLWLHAFVKDKPLNFLDHRIKCGDSLVGATPEAIKGGIIPEAFTALRGEPETGVPAEDARVAKELAKVSAKVKEKPMGASSLISFFGGAGYREYVKEVTALEGLPEDSPLSVNTKAGEYKRIQGHSSYKLQKTIYDTWVSSFFWPMTSDLSSVAGKERITPTGVGFRDVVQGRGNPRLLSGVEELSAKYRFFNWQLEFPEVFERSEGGFDCFLTNPPWEVLKLEEEEYFAGKHPLVEGEKTQAARRARINALAMGDEREKALHREYCEAWIAYKKTNEFYANSMLYPLSARGQLNSFQLFVEQCHRLLSPTGRAGMVVPTGLATNYYTQDLFAYLVENNGLHGFYDFENKFEIFPIHRSFRFSLLTIGGGREKAENIPMAFYLLDPAELEEILSLLPERNSDLSAAVNHLPLEAKLFSFTREDFETLNPNTLTCPIFRTRRDAELTRHFYKQAPILIKKDRKTGEDVTNVWGVSFLRMFDMALDSKLFVTKEKLGGLGANPVDFENIGGLWKTVTDTFLPLYEGKMIWHYDHRYNSVESSSGLQGNGEGTTALQYQNSFYMVIPRYWINKNEVEKRVPNYYDKKWFLGYRKNTNSTNERTMVVSVIARVAVGHTLPLILNNKNIESLYLLSNLNSIVFDYIVRQKFSGLDLNFFYVEQFPLFSPDYYSDRLKKLIFPRVMELVYNSNDLKPFAEDCGYKSEPFKWDEEGRALLKSELDAIYAHLYKISKEDLAYILDQFPVLAKNEEREHGEYRTKRLVLEAYDRLKPMMEMYKVEQTG